MDQLLPSEEALLAVLRAAGYPDVTLEAVEHVASPRLERVYHLYLSGKEEMVLFMAPSSNVMLMRAEQLPIMSEAVVLRWLTSMLWQDTTSKTGKGAAEIWTPYDKAACTSRATGGRPTSPCRGLAINRLLPSIVSYSPTAGPLETPYKLLQYSPGHSLATLQPSLAPEQLRSIAYQSGQIAHRISRLTSPSGRFGGALSVLGMPTPHESPANAAVSHTGVAHGAQTWAAAFLALVEDVLHDGEDMAIVLAYPMIRRHVQRLLFTLNQVTTARLVPINALQDTSICILGSEPATGRADPGEASTRGISASREEILVADSRPTGAALAPAGSGLASDDVKQAGSDKCGTAGKAGGDKHANEITISGLKDWSQCIFGDILFSKPFCEDTNEDFLRGYEDEEDRDEGADTPVGRDKTAHVRMLLYRCYHALVAIVQEFYRPQPGGSQREITARKRLYSTLAQLEKVEDDDDDEASPKARHRRPSGVVSPAKKAKADDEHLEA
ncbi:uncharacterized protein E0L32_009213 [Thyridium curvatum]|uniref:Uncharacterized protein n=1 Tax=Thyridium curvatum TaxID=1093900 RepID=A0A507AJK2_9PEZI|nr:uncharacterized protein E0L32_009213 [Thyridium curvatum]TPX09612.1 hypothetical protein E0L32_009213 [Thyridium curvatum]